MRRIARFYSVPVVFIFLAIGCGAPAKFVQPEVKNSDTFIVGVEQKKTVGEPMVEKMLLRFYPGFVAQSDYTPPIYSGMQLPTIMSGSIWSCPRQYEDNTYRCRTEGLGPWYGLGKEYPSNQLNLVISPDGKMIGYVFDPYDTVTTLGPSPPIFKFTEAAQPGSFRQELIYNGKSKESIKIAYREFKDNFARPAFAQDLTYDLSESREIGFRGMIIDVHEATNSFIRFTVKKQMNPQ